MTNEQARDVADALDGTADFIETVLERLDIEADVNDVEDRVLDFNIERCPGCDWWMESALLDNDDGCCDDCTESEKP